MLHSYWGVETIIAINFIFASIVTCQLVYLLNKSFKCVSVTFDIGKTRFSKLPAKGFSNGQLAIFKATLFRSASIRKDILKFFRNLNSDFELEMDFTTVTSYPHI